MHIRWRGLELPGSVTCDQNSLTATYGKFVAEPFERGFGTTIGNSLRRMLLSSLEGSAVTQIKIQGAQHEFTTIPACVEDMTDIVLNIKSLVVKNHSESTQGRAHRKEQARRRHRRRHANRRSRGSDQQEPCDRHIDRKRAVRRWKWSIENGRGYVPSSEHSPNVQEIGIIPIDAVYSPVVRVRYEIEETRVGQKTNYDKLTLGNLDQRFDADRRWRSSSRPRSCASTSIRSCSTPSWDPALRSASRGGQAGIDASVESKLGMTLAELKLSVRAMNCLESENIHTVRDLVSRNEDQLLEVRNFGETTLKEVKEKLNELGLRLGMRVPSAPAAV